MRILCFIAALVLVCAPARADVSAVPAAFGPVAFLIGDWSGSGVADVGPGSGSDSFKLDLAGHVLVRRSQAAYRAEGGKPGGTYSSLMIIFPDPAGAGLRADYFDSGGHTIHYQVAPAADAHIAQFISTAEPSMPRFRLTYTLAADNRTMHIKFELAPPGSESFSTTIAEGIDTRVSGP